MRKARLCRGNTLILITVIFFAVTLVAFLILNYAQVVNFEKQGQTAVDAAALVAAKDIARIVYQGRYAKIAMVDDPAGDANGNPIFGVNTMFATVRLDLLIASRLGIPGFITESDDDYIKAQSDATQLSKIIQAALAGGKAFDKDGKVIDIVGDATAAYDAVNTGLAKGPRIGPAKLVSGTYKNGQDGKTGCPVPVPFSLAQVSLNQTYLDSNNIRCYLPDITFTVNGQHPQQFVAINPSVVLMSSSDFKPLDNSVPAYMPPSAVQASVTQSVNPLAHEGSLSAKSNSTITSVAYAVCAGGSSPSGGGPIGGPPFGGGPIGGPPFGGGPVPKPIGGSPHTFPSTALEIAFPDGRPSNLLKPLPEFDSIRQMMGPWGRPGHWSPAYRATITTDEPGPAFSRIVYDWIKSLYLRPNIDSIDQALSTSLSPLKAYINPAHHVSGYCLLHVVGDASSPSGGGTIVVYLGDTPPAGYVGGGSGKDNFSARDTLNTRWLGFIGGSPITGPCIWNADGYDDNVSGTTAGKIRNGGNSGPPAIGGYFAVPLSSANGGRNGLI